MPIKLYKCPICGHQKRALDEIPECNHIEVLKEQCTEKPCLMEELLSAPRTKFMEKIDEHRGKSQLRDQQKILRKRAREYSRDNEMHELIAKNPKDEAIKNGWINQEGKKRKAIDDI